DYKAGVVSVGAEVDQPARERPGAGMGGSIAHGVGIADDLAAGVHGQGRAGAAAESAEVEHPTCLSPRERTGHAATRNPDTGISGCVTPTDDLAAVVHRLR